MNWIEPGKGHLHGAAGDRFITHVTTTCADTCPDPTSASALTLGVAPGNRCSTCNKVCCTNR